MALALSLGFLLSGLAILACLVFSIEHKYRNSEK